jgi:hypothetical protein
MSNRNFVVLLYSVSTASVTITMLLTLVFVSIALSTLPGERSQQSQAPSLFFPLNTSLGIIQYVYATSVVVSFVLLWSCTVMLLHQYSKKLGRVKLWVILSLPLAAQMCIFFLVIPIESSQIFNYISLPNAAKIYINIFGLSLAGILAGIMSGVPFLIIARSISHSSHLRDYLIIAGFGLVLFDMSGAPLEGTATGPYPPLGLASVLFAGLSCFLILVGLYYSALSISENSSLRQSIRESAIKETKLLDSIATADMEIEIQKRVMRITKAQANTIAEESGVETAISDDELKQYLQQVLEEIQDKKDNNNITGNSQ